MLGKQGYPIVSLSPALLIKIIEKSRVRETCVFIKLPAKSVRYEDIPIPTLPRSRPTVFQIPVVTTAVGLQ